MPRKRVNDELSPDEKEAFERLMKSVDADDIPDSRPPSAGLPGIGVGMSGMDGTPMDLETSVAEMVKALTSDDKIKMLSDIERAEIVYLSVILSIDRFFKKEEWKEGKPTQIQKFVEDFLQLRVSLGRKGRYEIGGLAGRGLSPLGGEGSVNTAGLFSSIKAKLGL